MTRRDRIVIAVIVGAALVAGYWFLLLAPKRQEAAALGDQVAQQAQRLQTARAAIASGTVARRDYGSNYAAVARLGEAVPSDDNVPSLVYQLDSAAHTAGVDFRAVKLTQTPAAPGASSAAATPSAAAPGGSTAAAASGSAPATQSATASLPPGASVGPAGFPSMPFALTFDGSFFHMDDFLHRLHAFVKSSNQRVAVGGRLLAINGIALTAGRKGFPSVKASVGATAYLLPANQGLTGGASPGTPAAASSSRSASTPGGSSSVAPAPATATTPVR